MAKLTINEDACKGCGLALVHVPRRFWNCTGKINVRVSPHHNSDEGCIGCASCARMCPDLVFTVENNGGRAERSGVAEGNQAYGEKLMKGSEAIAKRRPSRPAADISLGIPSHRKMRCLNT